MNKLATHPTLKKKNMFLKKSMNYLKKMFSILTSHTIPALFFFKIIIPMTHPKTKSNFSNLKTTKTSFFNNHNNKITYMNKIFLHPKKSSLSVKTNPHKFKRTKL